MKPQIFFNSYPVFTYDEFAQFFSKEKERSPHAFKSVLTYHLRAKHITRIKQNLYAAIPLHVNITAENFRVDPFAVAAKVTDDAVICYHSALAFYGKAHSSHSLFTYFTHYAANKLNFQSNQYQRVPFPKKLKKLKQENFEVKNIDYKDCLVRVTSCERTLVDILDRPDLCGGWGEVWCSLETLENLNFEKVIEYALLLDNATTIAKVGYYLEQHQETMKIENHYLEQLYVHRPKHPHYMERNRKAPSQFNAKWNLMIPNYILENLGNNKQTNLNDR